MTRTKIHKQTEEVDHQLFKFGADLDAFLFNNQDAQDLPVDECLKMKNKVVQTVPCGINISPLFLCEFCFRFKEPRKNNKTNANAVVILLQKTWCIFFNNSNRSLLQLQRKNTHSREIVGRYQVPLCLTYHDSICINKQLKSLWNAFDHLAIPYKSPFKMWTITSLKPFYLPSCGFTSKEG